MASLTSEPIKLLEANFLENCAIASGAALIIYDHILTFNQEVKFFWGKKSLPAVLFFINRLLALAYGAVSIALIYSETRFVPSPLPPGVAKPVTNMPFSCEVEGYAWYSLVLAIRAVFQLVTLQRVYAVTERNWRSTTILALLSIALLGLDTVLEFVNESIGVIVLGSTAICYVLPQPSFASTYTKLTITVLVISTVLDVVALGVIWKMLYKQLSQNSAGVFSQRPSLVILLLRDGTIELLILLLLNLSINILVLIGQNAEYVLANLSTPLITILISRILLNIQETARAAWREQSDTPSFVRSGHGVQTEADIDVPSLVIPSDASNSIPAIGPEREPSIATANQANAVVDETMIAGPSNQHRHREAQEDEVPMEAGPSGQGREHDVEQGPVEREAAEDWEEEDDWEDDY